MSESAGDTAYRSGFVAVVGRPNVGKSTLVNRLVGQKVAIVSPRPQTTRNRVLAVVNMPGGQMVLLDTPGIHKPVHRMNERMVAAAVRTLSQVEVVLWLVEAGAPPGPGDRHIRGLLQKVSLPVVLGVNKIDAKPRPEALVTIDRYRGLLDFREIVPLSALEGDNVERLGDLLLGLLPEGEPLYPAETLSDQPERFFVAEMVRERILKNTRDEVPYSTGVLIESFKEQPERVRIEATIFVERETQKGIVIGRGGTMLKKIGSEARHDIERFLGARVYLGLFVKVRPKWREDKKLLEEMGL